MQTNHDSILFVFQVRIKVLYLQFLSGKKVKTEDAGATESCWNQKKASWRSGSESV